MAAVGCGVTFVVVVVPLSHELPGGRVPPREIEDMVAGPRPDEVHRDRHSCRDEVGDPEQEAPVGEVDKELVSLCHSRLDGVVEEPAAKVEGKDPAVEEVEPLKRPGRRQPLGNQNDLITPPQCTRTYFPR